MSRSSDLALSFNLRSTTRILAGGVSLLLAQLGTAAYAEDAAPTLSVALRETLDAWGVPAGINPGAIVLNKLQISGTVEGERRGLPGWSAHVQVFRVDGASLSARLGDIQTADNIEADPVMRLFEAWVQKTFGSGDRSSIHLGRCVNYGEYRSEVFSIAMANHTIDRLLPAIKGRHRPRPSRCHS